MLQKHGYIAILGSKKCDIEVRAVARAKRHYIPGQVWHLTHRCHKREFLLKLVRDRRRWVQWLFEAKKRYGLVILNYTVTSNHIHLLVVDDKDRDVIPDSIKLIAGRTGQEYNIRKKRKGAFWEDLNHATAVENGEHLLSCLVYIDLNMVRAGVVRHPSEWPFGGYNEIQEPKRKNVLIRYDRLRKLGTDHVFSSNTKTPDADLLKTLFSFESVGDRYRERLERIKNFL